MRLIFADTNYWIAVSNPEDQWHAAAMAACEDLGSSGLLTTHEVLAEFLTFVSPGGRAIRERSVRVLRRILVEPCIEVVPQSEASFVSGVDLYERRPDKAYSLTDCVSMSLMRERGIREVLTHDDHFAQEGFTLLMR